MKHHSNIPTMITAFFLAVVLLFAVQSNAATQTFVIYDLDAIETGENYLNSTLGEYKVSNCSFESAANDNVLTTIYTSDGTSWTIDPTMVGAYGWGVAGSGYVVNHTLTTAEATVGSKALLIALDQDDGTSAQKQRAKLMLNDTEAWQAEFDIGVANQTGGNWGFSYFQTGTGGVTFRHFITHDDEVRLTFGSVDEVISLEGDIPFIGEVKHVILGFKSSIAGDEVFVIIGNGSDAVSYSAKGPNSGVSTSATSDIDLEWNTTGADWKLFSWIDNLYVYNAPSGGFNLTDYNGTTSFNLTTFISDFVAGLVPLITLGVFFVLMMAVVGTCSKSAN